MQVDEVKSGVSRIKKKVQEIEQFHGRQLTAVSGEESGMTDTCGGSLLRYDCWLTLDYCIRCCATYP